MVARAKDYIAAGDVFQVVLSQRYSMPVRACRPSRSTARCGASIRRRYLCFLDFGDFQIACSSPEILVRLRGDKVTIRPIAGTRRRGETPAEDEALAAELLADPKECAEHLMLLDLGRNDVGRVAADRHGRGHGQVLHRALQPRHAHRVERRGPARPGATTRIDALAAGFPAGTVSGAPKVRAMEIIDELERDKRGIYGGCIGYFGADGDMDTCIVLRTSVIKDGIDARPGRRRHRLRFRYPRPRTPNAPTRPRRWCAPPRRRCASRRPPSADSEGRGALTQVNRFSGAGNRRDLTSSA